LMRAGIGCVNAQLKSNGPSNTMEIMRYAAGLLTHIVSSATNQTTVSRSDEAAMLLQQAALCTAFENISCWIVPTASFTTGAVSTCATPLPDKQSRRSLDCILPNDRIEKQSRVHYMYTTPSASSFSSVSLYDEGVGEPEQKRCVLDVRVVSAVLLNTHRDNPLEDPFYTLLVNTGSGDREIQTVGERCVLDNAHEYENCLTPTMNISQDSPQLQIHRQSISGSH
jgi:hypothetical protein